jgi:hypothetical protein
MCRVSCRGKVGFTGRKSPLNAVLNIRWLTVNLPRPRADFRTAESLRSVGNKEKTTIDEETMGLKKERSSKHRGSKAFNCLGFDDYITLGSLMKVPGVKRSAQSDCQHIS